MPSKINKIAIIDGDIVAYRCAASANKPGDTADVATERAYNLITQIMRGVDTNAFRILLSGKKNFRKAVYSEYKQNRKEQVRPPFLDEVKQCLKQDWNAEESDIYEADDLMAIYQGGQTVICTLDKDLLQVPGEHYRWEFSGPGWTKPELHQTVTELDGLRWFYRQMLIGDTSDNIKGVKKVGPVMSNRIIDPLDDEQDMFDQVFSLYEGDANRFLTNAMCLWLCRKKGEFWIDRIGHLTLPDSLKHEVELMSEFMKLFMAVT
jgi:DNA polymerase-1